MKRAIALLLAMLMLATAVASCGTKQTTSNETTTAPVGDTVTTPADTSVTVPEETVAPELRDDLPEVNYNGETFTVLIREDTKYEMLSEEMTGDLLSDAVYQRDMAVEERFGVNIEILTEAGKWADRESFTARVSNSILGGDHEFDIVMTSDAYLTSMPARGLAYDMTQLDAIDFSKKWWHQGYMENAEIFGAIYTAAGDIGVTVYEYLEVVFFNKKLAEEHQITDLYETVQAGDWTFEKMMSYVTTVGADLNGDGKYDTNDLYGLAIDAHNCRHTAVYWEVEMSTIGADGLRDLALPNEKYIDTYDRLYDAIYNHDQVFFSGNDGTYDDTGMFTKDQILFITERLGNASKMKDMESEYGIIPFPKYDENQTAYHTTIADSFSGVMVSSAIKNPDMVGTIIEALCMYGYNDITPAYYETTLKLKYLSDETAMSMIDLVRDSVVLDFTMIYTNSLSLMFSYVSNSLISKISGISSGIKAQARSGRKRWISCTRTTKSSASNLSNAVDSPRRGGGCFATLEVYFGANA